MASNHTGIYVISSTAQVRIENELCEGDYQEEKKKMLSHAEV